MKIEIVPPASIAPTKFDWTYVTLNKGIYTSAGAMFISLAGSVIYCYPDGRMERPVYWQGSNFTKLNGTYRIENGRITFNLEPKSNEPLNLIGLPVGTVIEWNNKHYGRIVVEIVIRNGEKYLKQLGDDGTWSMMDSIDDAKVLGTLKVSF